jgi:hypothetical protein
MRGLARVLVVRGTVFSGQRPIYHDSGCPFNSQLEKKTDDFDQYLDRFAAVLTGSASSRPRATPCPRSVFVKTGS